MNAKDLLVILFLFFLGSIIGWVLEVIFNKFNDVINPEHKWINPGFLQGPYLPIYGFGVVILYCISLFEKSLPFDNIWFTVIFIFVISSVIMTLLELLGGLFFLKFFKMCLWNYSKEKLNYKGIICIRFTILWGIASVIYYFLINPFIVNAVRLYVENIEFSFIVGMFYGFLLIDLFQTMDMATRLRKLAKENELIIAYEKLKNNFSNNIELTKKHFFILPDHEQVINYIESLKKIDDEDDKRR